MNSFYKYYLFIIITCVSCKERIVKKTEISPIPTHKLKKDTTYLKKEHVLNLANELNIGDSISAVLTKEYLLPEKMTLKQDSSFYYTGTFLTLINKPISDIESLKKHIKHKFYLTRQHIEMDGNPKYSEMGIFKFSGKTYYDWFLTIDTPASSDYMETILVGFQNSKGKLIAQELSMNLTNAILKDSILIFNQDFSEPLEKGTHILIDSVRLNIYSLEKEIHHIENRTEFYE